MGHCEVTYITLEVGNMMRMKDDITVWKVLCFAICKIPFSLVFNAILP